MNNFPVDVMRELSEGVTIIGVDVSHTHETAGTFDFEVGISGWQVLWSRINPFAKRMQVPSIGSTLIRSMEVNSAYENKTREMLADILIQPEVKGFGSSDTFDRSHLFYFQKPPYNNRSFMDLILDFKTFTE